MKVVINRCFGGFSFSKAAAEHMGIKWDKYGRDLPGVKGDKARADPRLVAAVEALGRAASGPYAELRVVEIPDGADWRVDEYDGFEHVAEGRTWPSDDDEADA